MVAKVYEKLWPDSRPAVPFEEVRELLVTGRLYRFAALAIGAKKMGKSIAANASV